MKAVGERKWLWILGGLLWVMPSVVLGTNGDNLIGFGPNSRAMGGTGTALSQDVMTSLSRNPATLTFFNHREVDFFGTLFFANTHGSVASPPPPQGVSYWDADSQAKVFPIPAFGMAIPLPDENWVFGLGVYGFQGLGTDYVNKDPMNTRTAYSVLKFAPAIAYKHGPFSFGISLEVAYAALDLGQGVSDGFGVGGLFGLQYRRKYCAFGISYTTPQKVVHPRLFDFDRDGKLEGMKMELPGTLNLGFALTIGEMKYTIPTRCELIQTSRYHFTWYVNLQWINWSEAEGYKDFDWNDQWVIAVGFQYRPVAWLAFRIGYNYGECAVDHHNRFNAAGTVTVQGNQLSQFAYEYFRIIGFPGIVEHHISAGVAWDVTPSITFAVSYVYGFPHVMKETDTSGAIVLRSSLRVQSLDFGVQLRF